MWRSIAKGVGIAALGVTGCSFVIALFVLALFLIKFVWGWAVPDLFPGAVEQGLIAKEISWYTALKLAVVVAVIGGITGHVRNDS